MRNPVLLAACTIAALASSGAASSGGGNVGPLVRALWVVHRYGTPEAIDLKNDQRVKGALAKALGKTAVLTSSGVQGLMEPSTFDKLAGADGQLDALEVRKVLDAAVPESRKRLSPKVAA